MNHSIVTADRKTHLKVAALAVVAGLVFIVVGFTARISDTRAVTANSGNSGVVVKAGKSTQMSTSDISRVR